SSDHLALHSFPTRRSSDLRTVPHGWTAGLLSPHRKGRPSVGRRGTVRRPCHNTVLPKQRSRLNARLRMIAMMVLSAALAAEPDRSEEHTSELQSPCNLVCR